MARYHYRDRFHRQARRLGLPSRAAFKLEELLERFGLLHSGGRVLDLGCAPGGWLTILAPAVGAGGRVVGVDLAACRNPASNVMTVAGDIRLSSVRTAVAQTLGGTADLVTSDLAPRLSGIAARDQAQSRELVAAALEMARSVLKPGGAMVVKVFMGSGFEEVRALLQQDFARVALVHAHATRPGSSELYLVLRGFQPGIRRAPA